MLLILKKNDIGWASQINRKLEEYQLEKSWDKIADTPLASWKNKVISATETMNKDKLIEMCNGAKGEKTKTKFVHDALKSDTYKRKPMFSILKRNKLEARVQLMGMFGMLNCARNFKSGNGGNICRECNVLDDENHRINDCRRFREINLYHSPVKYDFDVIFLDDNDAVSRTIEVIMHVWNLENGKNEMREDLS